jgi:hypothetical protein
VKNFLLISLIRTPSVLRAARIPHRIPSQGLLEKSKQGAMPQTSPEARKARASSLFKWKKRKGKNTQKKKSKLVLQHSEHTVVTCSDLLFRTITVMAAWKLEQKQAQGGQ